MRNEFELLGLTPDVLAGLDNKQAQKVVHAQYEAAFTAVPEGDWRKQNDLRAALQQVSNDDARNEHIARLAQEALITRAKAGETVELSALGVTIALDDHIFPTKSSNNAKIDQAYQNLLHTVGSALQTQPKIAAAAIDRLIEVYSTNYTAIKLNGVNHWETKTDNNMGWLLQSAAFGAPNSLNEKGPGQNVTRFTKMVSATTNHSGTRDPNRNASAARFALINEILDMGVSINAQTAREAAPFAAQLYGVQPARTVLGRLLAIDGVKTPQLQQVLEQTQLAMVMDVARSQSDRTQYSQYIMSQFATPTTAPSLTATVPTIANV